VQDLTAMAFGLSYNVSMEPLNWSDSDRFLPVMKMTTPSRYSASSGMTIGKHRVRISGTLVFRMRQRLMEIEKRVRTRTTDLMGS
jgi:hypothetical protein